MRPLQIAVNLSARQFRDDELVSQIAHVLADTGLDGNRLEVELTASILIDESEKVARTMAALGVMGVSIAIDDFGTGQSSLRYLKRFNVDTLKIDRSFVRHTPTNVEGSAIAKAVIALGHGLGPQVVAEGVETLEQLEFLRMQGCDQLQGYAQPASRRRGVRRLAGSAQRSESGSRVDNFWPARRYDVRVRIVSRW